MPRREESFSAALAGNGRRARRLGPSVVTIGIFDGVHRGHQRIVGRALSVAAERGLPVAVVTFDPHPDEVIRPGSHPPLLCTPAAALNCSVSSAPALSGCCHSPWSFPGSGRRTLSGRSWRTGWRAAVVVGENFRFGHRAAGNVALLGELGEKYEFTAEGVPLLAEGG